jgi:cell division protease FtsH
VGHLQSTCDPVERVTVIPQGQALGVTISLPVEDRFLATRTECVERLRMMLAGRAAEELVFGDCTSGAADDLTRAATLARRMAGDLAMAAETTEESLLVGLPAGAGDRAAEDVERAAQALVRQAYREAKGILAANRDLLEDGALALLEREALEREEIAVLFGARPEEARLAPVPG